MAHIKSRKHPIGRRLNCSAAVALAVMALPGAVYAQQTETLPEITVQGTNQGFKADAVSSAKYTQPLLNTPQTISVIKKELVQQQAGATLTEALRNTPGVGTFSLGENGNTTTGDAIFLRGFDASNSIYVDGVRDLGSISRDLFNIEQVEVTKGSSGSENGRGAPTGSVNLSTKQPSLKEGYSGSIGAGSGDYKRVTADLNKPLNFESGAAFRINLLKDDSGVAGRDVVKNDREGIAAAIAFGLKTDTRTYLNYLHVNQENIPDGGVPTIGFPGYKSSDAARPYITAAPRVNSSNFYGTKDDFDNVKADMFTFRFEHDFSQDLKLQNTMRYGKNKENYLLTGFVGNTTAKPGGTVYFTTRNTDPSTWTWGGSDGVRSQRKDQENEIITNQTNLTAKFKTGSIKHALVMGLELTRETQKTYGYGGLGTLADSNLYNPDPNVVRVGYNPVHDGADSKGQTDTISVYAFDTLELNSKWQLNGGIRVDRYETDYSSAVIGTTRNKLPLGLLHQNPDANKSATLLNWKLGALYKPTEDSSVYVSYATSKLPPSANNFEISADPKSNVSTNLDPQETTTAEIGGKWDVLNKRLGLTAAIYRTEVSNEVEGPRGGPYTATGKKRVQGIELGAVGNISRAWSVSAGYTYMDTDSSAVVASDGSSGLPYTPKQAFTAWTSYRLPHGFTVGGGARFVDELTKGSDGATDTPDHADSYWVYDAMLSYAVNKNFDLQLNVYNLTDEDYAAGINKSGYRYTPGIPRSARLTANFRF